MSDPNALDEAALAPYLEAAVPGFHGFRGLRKFDSGQSNPTYLVEAESGRYVLRAKPPGQLLKSAHQVEREYRVMAARKDPAVPVLDLVHLASEYSQIRRMSYVMAFIEGRICWDPALPELSSASGRGALCDAMNRVLAEPHDIAIEAAG